MKNVLLALSVMAGGLGLGWLIFGLGGRLGDMAIGAVAGVCLVIVAGTYFTDRGSKSDRVERREG